MPALILIQEGQNPQIYPLGKATLLIGREVGSDVLLPSEYVSMKHASIVLENGYFILNDNGSSNGTYVNGELVSRCVLKHLDLIRFGTHLFQVNFKETPEKESPKTGSRDIFIEPTANASGASEEGLLLKISEPLSREEYDQSVRQWLKKSGE